jgi:hypothetical protein
VQAQMMFFWSFSRTRMGVTHQSPSFSTSPLFSPTALINAFIGCGLLVCLGVLFVI